jgi:hypothetical protein
MLQNLHKALALRVQKASSSAAENLGPEDLNCVFMLRFAFLP